MTSASGDRGGDLGDDAALGLLGRFAGDGTEPRESRRRDVAGDAPLGHDQLETADPDLRPLPDHGFEMVALEQGLGHGQSVTRLPG